jgi:hypothetical protein
MFMNQSPESRQQLADLVQTLHMSEADVVAFAIQHLFEERVAKASARADEHPAPSKSTRRKVAQVV